MDWMGSLFLPGGALLFLSVVSTTLSACLGMPLLLVSPAGVLDGAAEALAIAAFLMLVARPLVNRPFLGTQYIRPADSHLKCNFP
ncbi:hypothetical protein [Neisseria meningitidis]|uniref:hypothetical protein n=1 Tax=Neisseria meningitidis TaxID=487 RepID=UPI000766A19C|nr:hypothetical protein [Neisseria meningitidis]CWM51948.1 potassium/proton antiporter [Neisseria meningitidis]CWQ33471.1 potassium/proton antiporter [Neisseria meningitidis]